MDAVEFVKNYIRMCAKVDDCNECPCYETDFCKAPPTTRSLECAEEAVKVVEEWAAAHPVKTRQSVFLEQWPDAKLDGGILCCPQNVNGEYRPDGGCICANCYQCRSEFWLQEVE